MKTKESMTRTARRPWAASPLLCLVAAAIALTTGPLLAADAGNACQGRNVRSLGGPHAVSRVALRDLADLQQRLPQLEVGMRAMIASDPSIGAGVADALFAAIRAGSVSERKLGRQESMAWMVYQPKPGELARIAPPCVDLDRDYDAFEVAVEVAEPVPVAAQDARCELAVTRNCEHENPTITLDLTGSSVGATVAQGDQQLAAQAALSSVSDTTPCSQDQTFTVHALGTPPPPQTARVYRFLIPKACSNLTYLGEEQRKVIAAAGPPASCDKSVTAPQCQPWAAVTVDPLSVEVHSPVAVKASGGWSDCSATATANCAGESEPIALGAGGEATFTPGRTCCGEAGYELRVESQNANGQTAQATAQLDVEPHDWVLRPSIVYFKPLDGDQQRDITLLWGQSAREQYEIDSGLGLGLALEKRLNSRWGIEGAAVFGRAETSYDLTSEGETGEVEHDANFYAFMVGPNVHLTQCKAADVYLGLFVGYGGLADPIYRTLDHRFQAQLDGNFIWGAQLGVDVPFSPVSDWGFHGGLRYILLDQETDAGTIDVNPLLVEAGLSYRF